MDSKEFKERYLRFYPKLYRLAFRIVGDEATAEDIVQDAYANLWDMRESLSNINSPEAYCITTLKNTALEHLRRQSRTEIAPLDDEAYHISCDSSTPTERLENSEQLNSVIEIMEHLPPQQREVMRLRTLADYSLKEIEEAMGLSDINVRTLLSRARKRLKEIYNSKLSKQ